MGRGDKKLRLFFMILTFALNRGIQLFHLWDLFCAKNGIYFVPKMGFCNFLFGFLLKQKWIKVILLNNLFLLGSVADKIGLGRIVL